MTLRVTDVLVDGIRRTVFRNGLAIVLATHVLSALYHLFLPFASRNLSNQFVTPEYQ